jgi:exosome complex exonuclease DIS3/RRP44
MLLFTQFDSFLASAKAVGVELEVEDSKKLADSLDRAENPDDPYFNKVNFIHFKKKMHSI